VGCGVPGSCLKSQRYNWDTSVEDDAEESWRAEIYRRLQQIDKDAVQLISWEDARGRLLL
jgi:hypothetical protein